MMTLEEIKKRIKELQILMETSDEDEQHVIMFELRQLLHKKRLIEMRRS